MTGDEPDWSLAYANVDGRPMVLRCRDPLETKADPTRPHLLVVDLRYLTQDEMQLPSDDDYDMIAEAEARVFDTEDVNARPELVFVETGSGVVRYYCYTSDPDRAGTAMQEAFERLGQLTFSSSEDPKWIVYQGRAALLHPE